MKKELLELPRWVKQFAAMLIDVVCALLATWLAFSLRLDEWHALIAEQKMAYILAVALSIPVFFQYGVYKTVLRFTGAHTLALMSKAVGIYGVLYFTAIFMLASPYIYRSIGLVQPIIMFILMALARVAASLALGFRSYGNNGRPVLGTLLIYGAGHSGMQIASALRQSGQYFLAGYIDDSTQYQGSNINGLMVYPPKEITRLIDTHGVTDILLAMPSIDRARRNAILSDLRELQVHVRSLPDLVDLAQGHVTVLDIKELDPDDLLGREPVAPNRELIEKNILGKTVLISGAGGSIGSELCRQILQVGPKQLLLLDHSEYGLYVIESELRAQLNANPQLKTELIPLLGNVRDAERLETIFTKWKIDTVYHAAAYKHVPLVEHNPSEGLQNNVLGTLNLAQTAKKHRTANFVLISTDKAVRPTNVMGATKRFAELVLQALANQENSSTCFSMVRFGNVLGSSGSVVPLFREQIKAGGPVTLTHAEVTRYFMTIPEAAQLVIQAGAMAKGGEVFVLDMGQPVKIYDLAKRMVELSGLSVKNPETGAGDIEIVVTGLRPGEKLYEELLIGENPTSTPHPRIMMAREDFLPWSALEAELALLQAGLAKGDFQVLVDQLQRLVNGYQPSGNYKPAA
ncbi:nucleoside-diphosphate sugar epimerase/dehydratase [Polynucleobacter sp. AP-Latsch-80-C2]|jgi:FlaA1/EpsC-like NDP-sugar epimerase|uniref:polysaccharide biosynthesis protein n=1 Tax=Polynucleobacter sp. AP-Latsch-80-C2 TaxID=2576931 RepID=UPI001C0C1F8C|nr:nucleoside-diphosphate sugar epimerase/dehydratase [Polynucleobacter sp. AP-Latsch-80-C2]MBU3623930.1 polysaccharide biosynthesis protein [Polynucleobacter sp. AP-Latsch-80-C2]